jgi:1-acyl-sn-glycerol-3-phosphate acyltransferase
MPPVDLPPVSNKALYIYRVLMKWFSFFVFGAGTLLLVTLIFPPMRFFLRPGLKFKRYGRRMVSASMRVFVMFMHFLRVVDLDAGNRDAYGLLSSKIIAANHPSLLDIVILFSLIPNADCIVNAGLTHTIVNGVIRQLYILNSLHFDDMIGACAESLEQGNCLIIFPEGTRTPRSGKIALKKGAARIALATGCGIIPVRIGGTDKYGLGKKDPWTGFNPRERYVYRLSMGKEIHPGKYLAEPAPAAARLLTRELQSSLFPNSMVD